MRPRLGLLLLLASAAVGAQSPPAAPTRVGLASVVERKAEAALDGAVRTLVLRDALFRNERLSTGAEAGSLLHVRLLDQTVITLGPSSEVVLDDFAVDPAAGSAEVSLKLSRGLLRFVGGQHAGAGTRYRVQTPVATIGVRGTSFDVKVGDGGETTVQLAEGELLFENDDGVEVVLDEPFESSSIGDDDDAPSEPVIDEDLAGEFDDLDLSDEQRAEDAGIADELEEEDIQPIAGEDADEAVADPPAGGESEEAPDADDAPQASADDREGEPANTDADADADAAAEEEEQEEEEQEDLFDDEEDW